MRTVLRHTAEGIATVEVVGLVTLAILAELQRDCYACMTHERIRALVVDFRGAVMLAEAHDVPQALSRMSPEIAAKPVANVCLEIDEPIFLSHAWGMTRRGLMRAVFTDSLDALSWAGNRCAVSETY